MTSNTTFKTIEEDFGNVGTRKGDMSHRKPRVPNKELSMKEKTNKCRKRRDEGKEK